MGTLPEGGWSEYEAGTPTFQDKVAAGTLPERERS